MNPKIYALPLCAMLFALCFPANAQQPGKIARIGLLESSTASGSAALVNVFRQELSKVGWIEGKNIVIEYRYAEGNRDRFPDLAAGMVRLKPDLIVVEGSGRALAAKRATTTIPIVVTNAADLVGLGLVESLAQPRGNVTGLVGLSPELNTKRLEIIKDTVPKLTRVGFIFSARGVSVEVLLKELRPAAQSLKLTLEKIETGADGKTLDSAFQTAKQKQVGAILPQSTRPFLNVRKQMVELAGKYHLPAIYSLKDYVDEGGLMSYGTELTDL